jgi:hypothetical protein
VIGTRLGASLAVTPATSITTGVNLSFLTDPTPGDLPVPNSDTVLSSVDIGFNLPYLRAIAAPRSIEIAPQKRFLSSLTKQPDEKRGSGCAYVA